MGIGYISIKGLNISRIDNLKWAKMQILAFRNGLKCKF